MSYGVSKILTEHRECREAPSILQAFVPAPHAESPSLRGLATAAGIAAAPGVASAGDEYLNYNMTGGHNHSF